MSCFRGQSTSTLALDLAGELMTFLEVHPDTNAMLTGSGTINGRHLYQGVSSDDSRLLGIYPDFQTTFAGRFVRIDLARRTIDWMWESISPENIQKGFAGAAIWASNPTIHKQSGTVYFGTGQNYVVPDEYSECISNADQERDPDNPEDQVIPTKEECNENIANHNYFNSIVALSTKTGQMKWAKRVNDYDAWNLGCYGAYVPSFNSDACPELQGEDYDFGMSPVLVKLDSARGKSDALVVGQKSGFIFCFGLDGELIWREKAAPGGTLGGFSWGLSYDGTRVIATAINSGGFEGPKEWTNPITGANFTGGYWLALDPDTGAVQWLTEAPDGAKVIGPPASTQGVTFATGTDGFVYSLESATGNIISKYDTGVNIYGGFSINDGCVYVGNGYKPAFGYDSGEGRTKLYAWCF